MKRETRIRIEADTELESVSDGVHWDWPVDAIARVVNATTIEIVAGPYEGQRFYYTMANS